MKHRKRKKKNIKQKRETNVQEIRKKRNGKENK